MGVTRVQRSPAVHGAQSIARAGALLRCIAAGHAEGVALRQLVDDTELDRTTAWRLVASLAGQGLVQKDEATGRYHLGLEAVALGAACMDRSPLVRAGLPAMKALARLSGDNVFLMVRSGDHSHCLHLEEGEYRVRSFPLNVGATRLLGQGVGSIALLARLGDDALVAHYRRHAAEYQSHDVGLARLRRWVVQTRDGGHSYGSAGGVAGIGLAFRVGSCADAALSLMAPRSRLPRARGEELALAMRREMRAWGLL